MKRIYLFLVLLNLSICRDEYYNVETRENTDQCTPRDFMEDVFSGNKLTVSDCVDRTLARGDEYGGGFYDKCCYMRVMVNGNIGEGCYGLSRERTLDVPGNIPQLEDRIKQRLSQNSNLAAQYGLEMTEGKEVKIYSLDCDASYIKYFASVLALFCLLF